jgi:hypothetical protein
MRYILRILSSWWFRIPVATLSALSAVLLALAWHARVWTWRAQDGDLELYLTTLEGRHPLIEDLRTARIRAGDDIDEIISRTEPAGVHELYVSWDEEQKKIVSATTEPAGAGRIRYTAANYRLPDFTRLWIAAKDGKVVYAHAFAPSDHSWHPHGHCLWAKRFFCELSQPERQELSAWLSIVD